ncbi:hypothetical protein KIL84_022295 [Mauremys mutica]|uniref:Uncharacterized protein n=1 Tax=Mauremys mutica TaxID=74926 RepID=A0A9D4B0M5_9SAUR|nr:hypothetical protein KIL84_022295 [Mauremys mutica]
MCTGPWKWGGPISPSGLHHILENGKPFPHRPWILKVSLSLLALSRSSLACPDQQLSDASDPSLSRRLSLQCSCQEPAVPGSTPKPSVLPTELVHKASYGGGGREELGQSQTGLLLSEVLVAWWNELVASWIHAQVSPLPDSQSPLAPCSQLPESEWAWALLSS